MKVVADLPVGDNLQDHLQVPLFVEVNKSVSMNIGKMLHPRHLYDYIINHKGSLIFILIG